MKFVFVVAAVISVFAAAPLSAAETVDQVINAGSKATFTTVSTSVREEMDPGGRYAYVTKSERTRINTRLDEMGTLLDKYGDVATMPDDDKLMMLTSQEEVNAILTKRDNDRLICKNVKPIGSNIPVKQCMTAGEAEARRRGDQQYLRRTQNSNQAKPTG